MLENPELLREWLICTLKKISEADPDAVSNYILALVKKNISKGESFLRSFLLEKLEIFLIDNTSKFVELLLGTLLSKSYTIIKPAVPDDFSKLSSPHTVDIASSEPTIVKSTKTSDIKDKTTKTDILKEHELKTKREPTNDLTDKLHSTSTYRDNFGSHKRKNVFDDKHNSITKESCKPSYSKEEFSIINAANVLEDKTHSKLSSKDEYTPGAKESESPERGFISKLEPPTPKKIKHDSTHGDTDYRERNTVDLLSTTPHTENVPKGRESPLYKPSARCKDYDEKGYCLLGNLCLFDHGSDPILVDSPNPTQFLTTLNFGGADKYEGSKSPFLPPLPTSPPRIPPPPPLPPPTGLPEDEAYNPESPGMHIGTHLNFYNPSKPPPQLPSSMRMQSLYFGKTDPYNKGKSGRTRELINITKIQQEKLDSSNKTENKDRTYFKPLNSCGLIDRESINHTHTYGDSKAKRFDFSRLGPSHRTKLEIRKIPSAQNTQKNLFEHFSKYGNVVNIEIAFDNDPESARVTFSSNSEATIAYRSTDAILQNRFIKVFWNNDVAECVDKKRFCGTLRDTNSTKEINTINISSPLPSENLKEVPFLDNIFTQLNDLARLSESKTEERVNENASTGIMPRTVYFSNPFHLESVKFPSKSTVNAKKGICEEEDITTKHKFKLYQAKSDLLKNAIEHEKLILEELMKPTTKKKRLFLKKTLDSICKRVENLTKELKMDNEELKKSLLKYNVSSVAVSKIAAKELLDAELDLYKKQHSTHSDDTTELLKKVNLMKTKAKSLGLIESSGAPKNMFRRNMHSRSTSLSVDYRPKNILVAGKNSKNCDKEDLKKHFKRFGEIEKMEETSDGIVLYFYTRAEAEAAFIYGTKFGDKILSLSWLNDSQLNVGPTPDVNEKPEQKANEMQLLDVEDEEEEDEEGARSWRR